MYCTFCKLDLFDYLNVKSQGFCFRVFVRRNSCLRKYTTHLFTKPLSNVISDNMISIFKTIF